MHQLINQKIDAQTKKIILDNYVHECRDKQNLPIVSNLYRTILREMWMEKQLQLLEESIARHDDRLYGFYSREEFIAAVLKGEFKDESLEPNINAIHLSNSIRRLLSYYRLTFLDGALNECTTPIVGVW
jgi:hypothetical protein